VGGPNRHTTNPRWWTASFLKNLKIDISQQWFDRHEICYDTTHFELLKFSDNRDFEF